MLFKISFGEFEMIKRGAISELPTHEVVNMPPYIGDQDLWKNDQALRELSLVQGGKCHVNHLAKVGSLAIKRIIVPLICSFDRLGSNDFG